MSSGSSKPRNKVTAALNRKAGFEYFIEESFEAGIVLTGTEVKSIRQSKISIEESFCEFQKGELFLINCHIPEYSHGNRHNHQPRRARKLLLHSKELRKLIGAVEKKGSTIVPLEVYFNRKNLCKIKIALATGKKLHDKRQTIKERDWNRQKQRVLKDQ